MGRRRHDRFEPLSKMQVAWRSHGSDYAISVISDLCEAGAFIHTSKPSEPGTTLHLLLDVPSSGVHTEAVVRRVVPGLGMGVEFHSMSKEERDRFEGLLSIAVPMSRDEPSKAAHKVRERSTPTRRVAPTPEHEASENADASPVSSGRTPRTERRAYFRHKVAAAVTLIDTETGQQVEGQLADLARMGCNVKAESFFAVGSLVELAITRNTQSFRAQARVVSAVPDNGMGLVFTDVDSEQSLVLDQWIAASMKTSWLSTVRRRSQRVLLKLPVRVDGRNGLGTNFSEDTHTISVSAHGATVLLSTEVADGQPLVLRNLLTSGMLECSVVYVEQTPKNGREVGISFTLPNRSFWRVSFPPTGWSPNDPDAKRA